MKNLLTYLLLMIFALPLWACQPASPAPQELIKMTASQERRIGQLQSLGGAYTSTQATHLLRMEDGKNLYLKTNRIDLNNEKYSGKAIEVMGEIVRTTDGNQVMTVDSIDVLDQEDKAANDLPQWKDFTSSALMLSFKYRDDYLVKESSDTITITKAPETTESLVVADTPTTEATEESEIQIQLIDGDPSKLAEIMAVDSLESADILAGGFTKSKITQKALEAYKKVSSIDKSTEYYLNNSKGVYRLSFRFAEDEEEKTSFQNMFYDVLASIDFSAEKINGDGMAEPLVDSSEELPGEDVYSDVSVVTPADQSNDEDIVIDTTIDITGFTMFESDSAGFSIQYPKSYYFGSLANKPADSLRSYEFGAEPLEEEAGDIILDVINSDIPDGTKLTVNGRPITKVGSGSDVVLYTQVDGKTYRITGKSSKEAIMKQMVSTID